MKFIEPYQYEHLLYLNNYEPQTKELNVYYFQLLEKFKMFLINNVEINDDDFSTFLKIDKIFKNVDNKLFIESYQKAIDEIINSDIFYFIFKKWFNFDYFFRENNNLSSYFKSFNNLKTANKLKIYSFCTDFINKLENDEQKENLITELLSTFKLIVLDKDDFNLFSKNFGDNIFYKTIIKNHFNSIIGVGNIWDSNTISLSDDLNSNDIFNMFIEESLKRISDNSVSFNSNNIECFLNFIFKNRGSKLCNEIIRVVNAEELFKDLKHYEVNEICSYSKLKMIEKIIKIDLNLKHINLLNNRYFVNFHDFNFESQEFLIKLHIKKISIDNLIKQILNESYFEEAGDYLNINESHKELILINNSY